METSYLAKADQVKNPVAICRTIPPWFKGRTYQKLAPPWDLRRTEDFQEYESSYVLTVLIKLDPHEVYDELGAESTLLCYEKDPTLCHRSIVAEWLGEALGFKIREHDFTPSNQKNLSYF